MHTSILIREDGRHFSLSYVTFPFLGYSVFIFTLVCQDTIVNSDPDSLLGILPFPLTKAGRQL